MSEKLNQGTLMRPIPWPTSASWPVSTPIFPSVVYASQTPDMLDAQYDGPLEGYTYSREGHPNADVVSARIDQMEGAPNAGMLTGSGMAALSAVLLGLCRAGDHVIGGNQLYGRSLRMMDEDLPRLGIETTLVDPTDADLVKEALRPGTKMILIELVSNPTLRVADLQGIARVAREAGVLLVVDNTFTTPRLIRPFEHGADIVLHSITKILGGHSDAMLGWVGARDACIAERLRTFTVTAGLVPSPFDAWLSERGLLSFDLRFERAQATAQALAQHFGTMPGVVRVLYPGLEGHPEHARALQLLAGAGNMVSFEIEGGRDAANRFALAARELSFAPTLGDVGTTLSHPASSSHRALSEEQRAALGISQGFFRVSVGLEDPDALRAVFARSFEAAAAHSKTGG